MSEQPDNPFASPQTDEAAASVDPPELFGRMPGSVKLAIGCVSGFTAINGLMLAAMAAAGENGAVVVFLIPLLLSLLVFVGLWRRNRLAWQWGRIGGFLGALLATVFVLIAGAGVVMMMSGNVGMFDTQPQIASTYFFMAIGLAFYAIPAVLLWTLFFSLGRTTARQYFNLICPGCGFERARAKGFFFRRAQCKRCKHAW